MTHNSAFNRGVFRQGSERTTPGSNAAVTQVRPAGQSPLTPKHQPRLALGRPSRRLRILLLICTAAPLSGGCPTVPPCEDLPAPYLILTAAFVPTDSDVPISVIGRACGGDNVDPLTLSSAYEVIVYAHSDQWYVQPLEIGFRENLNSHGYFMMRSHSGDRIHAFLAVRGLPWETRIDTLPAVDGEYIIAEAEVDLGA